MVKVKCKKCRKEIEHSRRGMCLNCYRKVTGLSLGKSKTKTKTKIKQTKTIPKKIQLKTQLKRTPLKKKQIKQPIKPIEPIELIKKESVKDNWWKTYLDSDILKQQELLALLPLVKELAKNGFPNLSTSEKYKDLSPEDLAKEQEKFNSHMLTTMLYSYINDLIELKDL